MKKTILRVETVPSKKYVKNSFQTTLLAVDNAVIGCATICYIKIMPTFDHPSGKRAHIMNVISEM